LEFTPRKIGIIAIIVVCVALVIGGFSGAIGSNDDQNWQVIQSVTGNVNIRDEPGYYFKNFADVWTWPRADTIKIGSNTGEDEERMDFDKVGITFNDGGTADCVVAVRFRYPTQTDQRREIHREFNGLPDNVKDAIYQHIVNVMKATAPMMTSSEHQSARKGEFTELVQKQSQNGIYAMEKVERIIDLGSGIADDSPVVDGEGNPLDIKDKVAEVDNDSKQRILATDIILDDKGNPTISQESPLDQYGIIISQLSITDVDYDPQTRAQFAAKKEAFLRAEQAKAERQEEVEQTLMVTQRALRELAEVEGEANKKKAEQVIDAEREYEVALQLKQKADTEASMRLSVAELEKKTAETQATQRLAVAKLDRDAASEEAESIRVLAAAQEEKISKAGAITEEVQVLAEIAAQRDVQIAQYLSQIRTPSTVIVGGGNGNGEGGSTGYQDTLMSLFMLRHSGVLPSQEDSMRNASEDIPLAPKR